jgi:PAS domain S-box-containing protein
LNQTAKVLEAPPLVALVDRAPSPKIPILLVDDQAPNILALESLLGDDEYALVKAASGPEALDCMLKEEFALVLLDVQMPGMDGFETAERIRKQPRSIHTPIIFISATSAADDRASRGYSLDAVDYIDKPVIPAILKTKVRVFVELYKKSKSLEMIEAALRRELEEHKKALVARRESDELYHKLFARANDAIIVFDGEDGHVVEVNKAAVDLYGYTRKEFRRLTAKDLAGKRGPESAGDSADPQHSFRWHKKHSGKVFPAEIKSGPVSLNGRRLTMVLARDVSVRRKAEEAERLKVREELQRHMVSTVSHELRTPIAAIKASAETLRMGEIADEKERPRFLKIIESQADRLGKLVEDLLILAEVESGNFKTTPSEFALRHFADVFLASMTPLAKRKDVKLQVGIDKTLTVRADQSHVAAIFQILVDNAIKYNRKGGGVTVEGKRTGPREATISVRDTGIGIPEKDLTLIFQQFHRTAKARELAIKGAGLGLHIIKTMVEANGGRIWAESVNEKGSTFHFTLPTAKS